MVYESPAAGRPVVCRKHSPWTMERDRKKSKAHLSSPEPLSEEVEEEEELEEENLDDHEMTEQEAQVLARLGQLNVRGLVANQGDTDGLALAQAESMPEGQRRRLRGSRSLSASYHNRLRSCVLNEKGSPLLQCARSYMHGTGGGQENAAPVLFAPVAFGEYSKCWLGRRQSPSTKDTSVLPPLLHTGSTGIAHPSNFQPHGSTLSAAADQSLLAAAAAANSSRFDKHAACDSPAPRGRSHRRSLSGASVGALCNLNDSAEALHGPSEGCSAAQGPTAHSNVWPHGRGMSEVPGQRRGMAVKIVGASSDGPINAVPAYAPACDSHMRQPTDVAGQPRHGLTPSSLPFMQQLSFLSMAKYGIAAFGVPASVQCCFVDPVGVQCPGGGTAAAVASYSLAAHKQDLARCTMSSPGDSRTTIIASPALGRHSSFYGGVESCTSGSSSTTAGGSSLTSRALQELCTEPLLDVASDRGVASHLRQAGATFLPTGTGIENALADSAGELELRRLTHPHPHSPQPARQRNLHVQQPQQQAMESLRPDVTHSQISSMDSATAAGGAIPSGAAVVKPVSMTAPLTALVPFDLESLARSAGTAFTPTNFHSLSASGHFSVDAVQGDVGSGAMPLPLSLWPLSGSTRNLGSMFNTNENTSTKWSGEGTYGASAWPRACIAINTACKNSDLRPVNSAAVLAASPVGAGCEAAHQAGVQALESNSPADDGGSDVGRDVRCDQDLHGLCDGADGDDGESWLRTSQQTPDPDDPSSAGKYSAVLLRRLQAAAEHEEFYDIAASGGHSGGYGFYHLQGSFGSELHCSSGGLHLGSHGSSSMEPSPLPRMSSRLRRLRVSPCVGGSGSTGPLTSPAPSHLLGIRSRSVGVTPGGVTCRRLRRRSDILVHDQLGQGSISARGHADIDELEDSDGVAGADEHMHDVGHQLLAVGGSTGRLRLLAERIGDQTTCGSHPRGMALPLQVRRVGGSLPTCRPPELRSEPMQRMFSQAESDPVLATRTRSAASQLLLPHLGEDFLSGLMDYDDGGAEYTTPPHTPLRGIGGSHNHETGTATRGALGSFTGSGAAPKLSGASASDKDFVADAPARCRPGVPRGLLQQRVTFAAYRFGGGADVDSTSPSTAADRYSSRNGDEGTCAHLLMSQSLETAQAFNRCLTLVANKNDRGSAERLWQEMCSRGVAPDADTLNLLLRSLSRSAADPEEAQLLVRDVCSRGGFSLNATAQRLLEEICFRFEQLNGSTQGSSRSGLIDNWLG